MSQFTKDIQSGTHFLATIKNSKDNSIIKQFLITHDTEFIGKSTFELTEWCTKRYGFENHYFYIVVDIIDSVNYTAVTLKDKRLEELANE